MTDLEILLLFCSKYEDDGRQQLKAPFSHGGYTYASDGFSAVRVKRIADIPDGTKYADTLDKLFTELPVPSERFNIPECEVSYELCVCCNGKGYCIECDGTGKVLKEDTRIINGVCFNVWLIARLLQLPNCKIGVNGHTTAARFWFDGGEGLLMPRMPEVGE